MSHIPDARRTVIKTKAIVRLYKQPRSSFAPKTVTNLPELFVEQLQDLYSAETQLIEALPKMEKAAFAKPLKAGFRSHLAQTKQHAKRLEKIFKKLKVESGGKTCQAMKGLIKEGSEMIHEDALPEVKDAGLIAAAQRVEHYEMAGYGTVRTFAQLMGEREIATTLGQTLKEEQETDKKLTVAAKTLNLKALIPTKNKPAKR